ncbi:MAG: LamG domain-containing protein, partial [Planctomycetota bacterium]
GGAEALMRKQPWQAPYEGEEATGASVLGLWTFPKAEPTQDGSGNGHRLALRGGSRFVEGGRFGGTCLEVFRVDSKTKDEPEGAAAANAPELNPEGAFTIDMWIKPKPEFAEDNLGFLVDKKYFHYNKDIPRANMGYCLYRRKTRGAWRMHAFLGFGTDSAGLVSQDLEIEPGNWYHVAFTYDGEGRGDFYLNGVPVGGHTLAGRGPVTPSNYPFVIGCRLGSVYDSFVGYIDQVRISNKVIELKPAE